jgi:hypothetical protein
VKAGTFHAGMIELWMKDGMVHVIVNPQLEVRIPPTLMDRVKRAAAQLEAGISLSEVRSLE